MSIAIDDFGTGCSSFAYLRDPGCHLGQGYLFSRPVPPAEMRPFLRLPPVEERVVRDTLVN